jgi:hypothetical protein
MNSKSHRFLDENGSFLRTLGPEPDSDSWGAGGSILQSLQVYKTGFRFPPYKYDPDASPGSVVSLSWRRNGQPVASRRIISPTLVRPRFEIRPSFTF